jgi:hypothetical protein
VLCRLFGTTFTPRRYHFFDLEPETSSDAGKVRRISYHNRIDASTGRVPEDVFFSYELGPTMTFTSRLERILPPALSDDEEAQRQADEQLAEEVGLLVAGLRLVERIGGKSARGFGVCQIEVGEPVQGRPVDEWLAAYVTPAGEGEQP